MWFVEESKGVLPQHVLPWSVPPHFKLAMAILHLAWQLRPDQPRRWLSSSTVQLFANLFQHHGADLQHWILRATLKPNLLGNGADIKALDLKKQTPLHWAVRSVVPESAVFPTAYRLSGSKRGKGVWKGSVGMVRLLLMSLAKENLRIVVQIGF